MINTCFVFIRLLPFCNFNVPCNEGHGRPLLALYLFSLDLCMFNLITRGLLRPFWPDWLLCIIFMFRFNRSSCNTSGSLFYWLCYLPSFIKFSVYYVFFSLYFATISVIFSVSRVSRAGYRSPSRSLWLVAALMRGDRNGTWPLLCGWSFPLPWWCWRLRRACGSEVSPFFTPAWISQTVIAPGGRPVQRRWRSR